MKLYYYRGEEPNFGDELNNWLMPKVFPDLFDEDPADLFLAIGSVLFDLHPKDVRKFVFGSGYGGYTKPPELDQNWKVYCVRGPLSAKACGIDSSKVAGDAAILINRYRPVRRAPKSEVVSFIPHWQSIERGNWQMACEIAGITFVDPRRSVDDVLTSIEGSSLVITEAMHGAIVADALRVPWVSIRPFNAAHRFKWFDWAQALNIELVHSRIWPSSLLEGLTVLTGKQCNKLVPFRKRSGAMTALDPLLTRMAASGLQKARKARPNLSSDAALARVLDRLETSAEQIRRDHRQTV